MIELSPRRQAALISTFLSAGFVIGFALTAAASGLSAEQTQLGGLEVIDGDTLLVSGRTREIDGIDAPELGQICLNVGRPYECGLSAAYALRKILAVDPVVCRPAGTDPARVECTAGQLDLAEILLRTGSPSPGAGPDQATDRQRPKPALPGLASGAAGSSIPPIGAPGHGWNLSNRSGNFAQSSRSSTIGGDGSTCCPGIRVTQRW